MQYEIRNSKIIRYIMAPIENYRRKQRTRKYVKTSDSEWIRSLKDSKKGKKCYIVGNGPSLRIEDLEIIKDEYSFGMNKIFEIFDQTRWRPDIYVMVDIYMIQRNIELVSKLEIPNILIDYKARNLVKNQSNLKYINVFDKFIVNKYSKKSLKSILFSHELDKMINQGFTVTYICLQLAIYMGFSEIILIGMDHNFARTINTEGKVIHNDNVKDHFYKGSDFKDVCQFRDGVECAYKLARQEAEKKSIKIYNATRGGKLEVFERKNFDDITKRKI